LNRVDQTPNPVGLAGAEGDRSDAGQPHPETDGDVERVDTEFAASL
jgi:hypothetical protein